NPIVDDLYRGHGVDHDFAGVIAIRTRWTAQEEKDLTAYQAAKLARLLGAAGAIISYDAGGNDFMEVMLTVQACERLGIKSVPLEGSWLREREGPPVLRSLDEADAIGSTGCGRPDRKELAIAAPARVLGVRNLFAASQRPGGRIPADS